jgi:hypothetical protein
VAPFSCIDYPLPSSPEEGKTLQLATLFNSYPLTNSLSLILISIQSSISTRRPSVFFSETLFNLTHSIPSHGAHSEHEGLTAATAVSGSISQKRTNSTQLNQSLSSFFRSSVTVSSHRMCPALALCPVSPRPDHTIRFQRSHASPSLVSLRLASLIGCCWLQQRDPQSRWARTEHW